MELTIILSHHLSKPIVHLVKYCESIRQGRIWRENDDISMKRSDEIGVLSRELKEMVNTLQKRNQQLQKLQQINNTILNSTHVGMVLAPNASATWQLNEMAKRTFNHFYILKEKVYQFILKNQHHTERTEEIWEFKNGSERVYFAANLIPITKKGEILQYLISFEDITKRKNLENQLQQMERLASLGELASGLAHEIRNPLSGIKATAELLMRRLKLGQDHRWLFENILKEIDRVQQIITHLLQLSRPIKTNPRKVNVEQVFKSTIALLEGLAEQQKVKIDYECENVELWIDLEHLRQILLNLLLNSIQAMPDGGKVAIKAFQQQHTAVIILQDSGVGIDQEIISKIFNPFFTTRNEGTGLGLSIVHQLVVLNNGDIHVESEVGIGSTFTLRFPMKRKGENDENINH
jgi:signal transduction histidine kinase